MIEIIDQLAPKKKKMLNICHTNEWYTEELLHLRQKVRKYEQKHTGNQISPW